MCVGSRPRWTLFGIVLFLGMFLPLTATPVPTQAQSGERCFPETGLCVSGRLLQYWEQNGGLPVFGLPITPQREETIGDWTGQVQWFERNRLELHPENAPPYDVLLGRLGAEFVADSGGIPPRQEPREICQYFDQTGFNVCGSFLAYWSASGLDLGEPGISTAESLALFGLPLTGEFEATLADGTTRIVQWFERARFELHPENDPPYDVLLTRLGAEVVGEPQAQPGTPTEPAGGNNRNRIVYTASTEVGILGDIYTINPDGSDRSQMTTSGDNAFPVWSPDKSRIAFARGGFRGQNNTLIMDLYVMNADGSGQTQLTSSTGNDYAPAWSPDGSQIAFVRDEFIDAGNIYVINADGSGEASLTNTPGNDTTPTWTPDGRIIFASDRNPPVERVSIFVSDLFIMNRDGANVTPLVTETANAFDPDVSPNGSRLAFSTLGNDPGSGSIYVANSDGSNLTNLTRGQNPGWSPDGTQLVFTVLDFNDSDGRFVSSIYLMNVDGTGMTELTGGTDPDW
jgi:Tol biopolymer transport system component